MTAQMDEVVKIAKETYQELCGDFGLSFFTEVVVPNAVATSFSPNELSKKLETITESASYHPPSDIDDFLRNAITEPPVYQLNPGKAIKQIQTWTRNAQNTTEVWGCRGIGIETLFKYLQTGGILSHRGAPTVPKTWVVEFTPVGDKFLENSERIQRYAIFNPYSRSTQETINDNATYAEGNAIIDYLFAHGFKLETEFDDFGYRNPRSQVNDDVEFYAFLDEHTDFRARRIVTQPSKNAIERAKELGIDEKRFCTLYQKAIQRKGVQILFNEEILSYPISLSADLGSIILGASRKLLPFDVVHGVQFNSSEEQQELIDMLKTYQH